MNGIFIDKSTFNDNIGCWDVSSVRNMFGMFMEERKNTGRIYLQNVDNANSHSSFLEDVAPIRHSNLCAEIDLPTIPLNDFNDVIRQFLLSSWMQFEHIFTINIY